MENKPSQEIAVMPNRVMTIMDYARKERITRQTVYNRIKQGKVQTIRLGSQQFIQIG